MAKIAVGSGFVFNLFDKKFVADIELKQMPVEVVVDGVAYPLHRGANDVCSERVGLLIHQVGGLEIRKHRESLYGRFMA